MKHYTMLEILEALKSQDNMPYSLYSNAADVALRTAKENPSYKWVLPYLQEKVLEYSKKPIVSSTFQQYANFDRIGERHQSDSVMYELRTRLNTMCLATLLDVNGAKSQCEDIIFAFLHLPTWSLTAHLLDHSREDYWDKPLSALDETGRITGIGRTRKQSQDLCSNSAAFTLSEAAQLLEGKIEPCLLRWSREECYERVLGNFMSLSPFLYYETLPTNWSGVCMSSIGAAAIYLITDPYTLAPVIMRVLEGLRVHESGYSDDGFCPEGFGYWQYGFEYFVMFSELLYRRTGGRIDLLDDAKMRLVAEFGTNCSLGDTLKLPFGDCNFRGIYDEALRRYIGSLGISVPEQGDTKASFLAAFEHGPLQLRHLVWTMQPKNIKSNAFLSKTYPASQCYIGSYYNTENPIYLLVKGGNNGESHNHNDVGSFVIIRNDNMLASDTGGGDYCKEYFREQRYTFFATRSGGHNVPIVDGKEQLGLASCHALSFDVKHQDADTDEIVMDLTGVLPCEKLSNYTRDIIAKKSTGHISVIDTFILNEKAKIQDRIVSLYEPIKLSEHALRIGGEMGMTLYFNQADIKCEINAVTQNAEGKNHIYTIDLLPIQERAGEIKICMDWDID